MAESYDAIIIGTGQAGPPLAVRLGSAGRKTAIIERKLIGGTCVNTGCIPTKTLIASARAAHVARRAAEFGVVLDSPVRVDMARVKARKDTVVAQSNANVTKWIRGAPNVTLIEGHARFEGPHSVRVNERLLEAPQIFINVGARAALRGIDGLADVPFFTNTGMMGVDFVPEHLLIVGGSYIGLEFAQMYRRFGSAVTVVEMGPRLIGREDEDVSAAIQAILEAEGIAFRLNAMCLGAARKGNGVSVRMSCSDEPRVIDGSHLLLAIGREPNTDDLGLELAGVRTDSRGYTQVDEGLQTSVRGIWAIGDVNGRGAFTHTSYNDYEIVAANLLDGEQRRVSDRIPTYALFIDPPLGRVGMTEREVRASGRPALSARRMMTRVGRARERSETEGFMQVLVDAGTKKILGAAVLGIEGDEAVHCVLDVMAAGAPYTVLQRAMHIHPTVSELLPTLLGDLKPLS
ncbi:MAG TPA: FAD-containing oxidoreductase [Casimicrobiaceae bacterium]|jgi:pyruvate/2-oxoglutarate dehydrogenase complex dihydrolipoamide dehydrogenase (E3) component|nr:FAD-containing oxidoreductase [Casimicrobiaceae bacterium]